eukprot:4289259-Prymnesium_polylepis.1
MEVDGSPHTQGDALLTCCSRSPHRTTANRTYSYRLGRRAACCSLRLTRPREKVSLRAEPSHLCCGTPSLEHHPSP